MATPKQILMVGATRGTVQLKSMAMALFANAHRYPSDFVIVNAF